MKIVLCDDCIDDVARYSRLLRQYGADNGESIDLEVFDSGDVLLFHLEDRLPAVDLIYMDIHMPGTDGMRTAQKLREQGYNGDIIFLTVDREKVFEAFEVDAMQYFVKDKLDEAKFFGVLGVAIRKAHKRRQEYICLTCAGETINVAVDNILFFSLENRIITMHYLEDDGKQKEFDFYSTLEKLENALIGQGFVRNQRGQIVSLRQIKSINGGIISLQTGQELPLSKRQMPVVRQRCEEYNISI